MKRREFITLLGGVAAAWPLAARAQQSERMRRIGVLTGLPESDPEAQTTVALFRQGMDALGWAEGRNVRIDYRYAAGDTQRIEAFANELVELRPDLIVARSSPVVAVLLKQTRTIPIVFLQVVDPVRQGFVASLSRPEGNVTGFTPLEAPMGSKWLEILKEAAPRVEKVAVVFNPDVAPFAGSVRWRPLPRRSQCRRSQHPFEMLQRSSAPSMHSHVSKTAACWLYQTLLPQLIAI
jgi:putative ABC transport system substrate-binding protein